MQVRIEVRMEVRMKGKLEVRMEGKMEVRMEVRIKRQNGGQNGSQNGGQNGSQNGGQNEGQNKGSEQRSQLQDGQFKSSTAAKSGACQSRPTELGMPGYQTSLYSRGGATRRALDLLKRVLEVVDGRLLRRVDIHTCPEKHFFLLTTSWSESD